MPTPRPGLKFNDKRWAKRLGKTLRKLKNKGPLLNAIGRVGEKDIIDHFNKERGPKGRWRALSPATKAARRKGPRKRGAKILQDTGKLLQGVGYNTNNRNSVKVGSAMEYGIYHQEGTNHIPKREWLYISKNGREQLMRVLKLFVKGAFK